MQKMAWSDFVLMSPPKPIASCLVMILHSTRALASADVLRPVTVGTGSNRCGIQKDESAGVDKWRQRQHLCSKQERLLRWFRQLLDHDDSNAGWLLELRPIPCHRHLLGGLMDCTTLKRGPECTCSGWMWMGKVPGGLSESSAATSHRVVCARHHWEMTLVHSSGSGNAARWGSNACICAFADPRSLFRFQDHGQAQHSIVVSYTQL